MNKYYSMSKVAQMLGIGRNHLFDFLRKSHVLNDKNTPYLKFIDLNYFIVKYVWRKIKFEFIEIPVTLVTDHGIHFIFNLLNQKRLLPL